MLKYVLLENKTDSVSYRYYPEGQKEYGTVTVRKSDKEIVQREIASNDDFNWCFDKLVKRIEEFIDADKYNENGIIAWY